MAGDILSELNTTKSKILEAISSFRDEDFNTIPYEGSWTAAQVAEHIHKSVSGILEILYGPVIPTARDQHEKVGTIRGTFLDFSIKMKSPEFVLPGQEPIEKEKIRAALEATLTSIGEAIDRLDLSPISTVFELPGLGPLTRAEWAWFGIYHTQRHTRQLENILVVVSSSQDVLK